MRTGISTLGILTALLGVGACFDPTRPCSTNADCENGGTCDPGTKTCVSAGNPNDKTAPIFSIVVTPPPSRQDTPKLTEYDPGSPDAGRGAFRRDENVVVTVSSSDPDVDASSVKLMVHGVATNPGTAVEVQLGPCAASNPAASNAFCREGTVQLAPLPFEAFRAVVPLEVSGSDLSDNVGRADAGLNVTRWKWRYSAGAPIYTTPAIADDGTIVFGTSDGGSGSLYGLAPDGTERWSPVVVGPIKASPVFGVSDGGQQLTYVATSEPSGRLFAVDSSTGVIVAGCTNNDAGYSGPFVGTPALVTSGTGSFEGVLALANAAFLVNFRPAAPVSPCLTSDNANSQSFPSNVVAVGATAYAGATVGHVLSFLLISGNWVENVSWGGGLGYSGVGNRAIQPLALTDRVLGTTSLRGLFALDRSTGVIAANYPDGGVAADPGGAIATLNQEVFGSGASPSPLLYTASVDLSSGAASPLSEPVYATPLAGKGGLLYVATLAGTIEIRSEPSSVLWSAAFGASESFSASPTLACGSHNGTGNLYLGSTSGSLFSVVVDSPGLDSSAPWPKYQHDVRNTGNPTTPIQSCP
jgi:PQQ-like domain